jgi:dihydroorotate dehydrogenase electron transfer subunit
MTTYADQASSLVTTIVENEVIAKDTMRLRVQAPDMSQRVVPGQFFMVRNPASNDPLIGRAFALYDTQALGNQDYEGWLDVVYIVKGKLTSSIAQLGPGASIALWGPLGNGFSTQTVDHLVMVAGGIGQTPFMALAKEALGLQQFGNSATRSAGYAQRVSLCYGARSAAYLAGVDEFRALSVDVQIATDDGSVGPPRLVTTILDELLHCQPESESLRIVCCGPEPMMEAVAKIASDRNLACQVSLETPMACGIGICFTCVAKIGTEKDWDFKRTCVEGPVFDSTDILWH